MPDSDKNTSDMPTDPGELLSVNLAALMAQRRDRPPVRARPQGLIGEIGLLRGEPVSGDPRVVSPPLSTPSLRR